MESLCIPSSTSLDEHTKFAHGELHRETKKKLYFGRNVDPAARVEIRIDQDGFDEGLALKGKLRKEGMNE